MFDFFFMFCDVTYMLQDISVIAPVSGSFMDTHPWRTRVDFEGRSIFI